MSGIEGLGRGEQAGAHVPGSQDEVRDLFIHLITFVAKAKASRDDKNDALQCIEVLQARLLP